jgi:hypothetical protein
LAILEKAFRKEVMDILGNLGDVTNHEDSWQPGIADLSFAVGGKDGWLELKVASPIGAEEDRIKLGFTFVQARWLSRRATHGNGRVYGLVRVWTPSKGQAEFFLYRGIDIKGLTDVVTMEYARNVALRTFDTLHAAIMEILQ